MNCAQVDCATVKDTFSPSSQNAASSEINERIAISACWPLAARTTLQPSRTRTLPLTTCVPAVKMMCLPLPRFPQLEEDG